GGLRHVMPITTTLAVIAGAAMAGVPLLNGFLSKEMFFAVALNSHHSPVLGMVTAIMAIAAAALGVAYSLRMIGGAFFGRLRGDYPRRPHEPPGWMQFPIGFLALACLAVGIVPALVIGPALRTAAMSVLGPELPDYSLKIWHGITRPLLMSVLAFGIGCLFYLALRRWFAGLKKTPLTGRFSAKRAFEQLLVLLTKTLPGWQRRMFPSRHLQAQLLMSLLLGGVATIWAAWPLSTGLARRCSAVDLAYALLWLLGCACAIGAATQAKFHRVVALTLSGATGLVVCINFV